MRKWCLLIGISVGFPAVFSQAEVRIKKPSAHVITQYGVYVSKNGCIIKNMGENPVEILDPIGGINSDCECEATLRDPQNKTVEERISFKNGLGPLGTACIGKAVEYEKGKFYVGGNVLEPSPW